MILKLAGSAALLVLVFFDWKTHGFGMGLVMSIWLLLPMCILLVLICIYVQEQEKSIFSLSSYTAWILIFSFLFNLLSLSLIVFIPKILMWTSEQIHVFYWLSPAVSIGFSLLGSVFGFFLAYRLEKSSFFSS
jgi:chromate transport protein ChrA